MLESFQNFTICARVFLSHIVELLTIICYGVKIFGSCIFLEKYSTKHFGTGIGVYFQLSVGDSVIDF